VTIKTRKTVQFLCSHSSKQINSKEIDIESILSRETVIALQDNICGEINAPTTIIQFPYETDDELDRIDSQVSAITLRTSCDLLRRCGNDKGKLCLECDKQHSEFLLGMSKSNIDNGELNKCIENMKEIWGEVYQNPHYSPEVNKKHNHYFFSYNCPMLGYRELVFPIFFEDNVVAVFFVGQIKLTSEENAIKLSKENFFKKIPDIFSDYIDECKKLCDYGTNPEKYTSKAIIDFIINESKRENKPIYPKICNIKQGLLIPDVEDQLSQEQFNKMVEDVCYWLDNLEEQLVSEMRRKYESYARDVMAKALSVFHIDTANVGNLPTIKETLWTPVRKFAKTVSEQCTLEYIVIYGVRYVKKKTIRYLDIVASHKLSTANIPNFFLLDSPLLDSIMQKPSDNRNTPELISFFAPIPADDDCLNIVFQPMKEIPAASVAIIIKYSDNMLKSAIEEALISGLQNLAALISSRLAVHFENAAQKLLEESLSLYKHEIINLSAGVKRPIYGYLGNPKLKMIDDQKITDVYKDAVGTLNMFEFLSKIIGFLIDSPIPPVKKDVKVYHDLLYKWENIRRVEARYKGCDVKFQKSFVNIHTDPHYAEIIVYNLLTNAVKYAYDNTMIYIHCTKSLIRNCYVLSVTNFTFFIPEIARHKIFEMRYRTENARAFYPDGSGIGLWFVREIMKLLGGNVKLCEPEWISDYNVPMLHTYLKSPDIYSSTSEEFQEAKEEYTRLSNEYIVNDFGINQDKITWIISKYNSINLAKSMVKTELHRATYKIRFEVNFYV